MKPRPAICAFCNASFEAQTSYGLCPDCYSADRLREYDRLEARAYRLRRIGVPASLTLREWLTVISDFNGKCAWCQEARFHKIELYTDSKGLVTGNVLPICYSCYIHRHNGWEHAMKRVQAYLAGENCDLAAKRYPVFAEEGDDEA